MIFVSDPGGAQAFHGRGGPLQALRLQPQTGPQSIFPWDLTKKKRHRFL